MGGVMVVEKNSTLPRHPDLKEIPNLHVIKVLESLKSRGLVDETHTWRHGYYRLNNKGITYLRETLHLPAEIVPATCKKAAASQAVAAGRKTGEGRGDRREYGRPSDRDYRRGPGMPDKTAEAGAGAANMEFRGMGRGAPRRAQ